MAKGSKFLSDSSIWQIFIIPYYIRPHFSSKLELLSEHFLLELALVPDLFL